ncbi:hypothetical protein AVEN_226581-1 [Araneus ventricosus]|uniref:Uncharacterized protein n=1 Tax=Araneus ventricosus TaxID=182803 RepID=A0A4Y2JP54_ARAVE|nr:hypothetical protein AVEN_226581-1 [Araneus ventricosus]
MHKLNGSTRKPIPNQQTTIGRIRNQNLFSKRTGFLPTDPTPGEEQNEQTLQGCINLDGEEEWRGKKSPVGFAVARQFVSLLAKRPSRIERASWRKMTNLNGARLKVLILGARGVGKSGG